MNDAVQVRVVEVQAVDQHAIGERSVPYGQPDIASDDAAAFGARRRADRGLAERLDTCHGRICEIVGIGGKTATQGVEDQQLGACQHRFGQLRELQSGGKIRERRGGGAILARCA